MSILECQECVPTIRLCMECRGITYTPITRPAGRLVRTDKNAQLHNAATSARERESFSLCDKIPGLSWAGCTLLRLLKPSSATTRPRLTVAHQPLRSSNRSSPLDRHEGPPAHRPLSSGRQAVAEPSCDTEPFTLAEPSETPQNTIYSHQQYKSGWNAADVWPSRPRMHSQGGRGCPESEQRVWTEAERQRRLQASRYANLARHAAP